MGEGLERAGGISNDTASEAGRLASGKAEVPRAARTTGGRCPGGRIGALVRPYTDLSAV